MPRARYLCVLVAVPVLLGGCLGQRLEVVVRNDSRAELGLELHWREQELSLSDWMLVPPCSIQSRVETFGPPWSVRLGPAEFADPPNPEYREVASSGQAGTPTAERVRIQIDKAGKVTARYNVGLEPGEPSAGTFDCP
jgi:hypothetical protein